MENIPELVSIEISKTWIDYASALLVPTLAVFGSLIALLQWSTNRNRLKHELFDRRYGQYITVQNFLGSVMSNGKVTSEAERDFLLGIQGIRFTFNDDISGYVNTEIWRIAMELEALEAELEGLPVGRTRSESIQKQRIIKDKIHDEFKGLEKKFSKYLELKH